jgi:cation diffusion facilitator CzcD-associated flavoprotein CzcO
MKKTFLGFVVDQWSTLPPVESVDLSGKTVVVVGANAGIGFEAVAHFARMGPAKLILACRSESRGKVAVSGTVSRALLRLGTQFFQRNRSGHWIQVVRGVESRPRRFCFRDQFRGEVSTGVRPSGHIGHERRYTDEGVRRGCRWLGIKVGFLS